MDKELPWLADNAQLELKYKNGKTPLSHRNWPGEPVPVITESIIQTLGDELLQKAEKKKNIVWRYENFSLEWQSAITQAINLIGEHKPSIPPRTMAALACIAQNDSQQLLDEIVQQEGLEYATEVVIARQFIARCYESDPLVVTLQYQDEDYGYGYRSETYNEFDLRLRKHLSLAEESCWQRFAGQRNLARQWILQWPEHTATALIPLVFTKSSDKSEAALLALRLLYEHGHGELLQTVANRWQRTDLWPALEQLLKQSPIEIYPARIPKAPDFWHPQMWSRPRLITNNQPVTDDALEIIGEMLRFTQGGRFYSGLEQLKTFCQPQTLAAFAWDLFTAWQQAGAPVKDNWAFLALSLFGDESTARDLTTQILGWPQEGKSARAVSGLNILTLMNNDMALIQLHHISQRAKSRPLRDNAAEFLQVVAENRGLSQEELADRLVPTLGLDDPQALSFDFGPRQFTVRFDENLNPVIFDQQNVRQKSVPRLRADDDQLKAPEALARLKGLKKDATQVSKNLLPRLETALRTTRRWSLADFHSLFVNHPFTRLVTQRLIWGAYPANEPRCLLNAFRVAAEGEFCNAQDEPIDLPADALIGIAHPLEMTVEMRSEFAQLFADYEIMPPFRQLARCTVLLTPDESTSNSLTRWEGKSATVGQLMGMRYKGWESGYEDAFVYDLGEYRLVLKFSPGFNHYNVDSKALMSFRSLRVYRDNKSVTFAELDVFDLSEALSAPDVIFH
ncbi:hypothetical protein ARC96_07100 [Escherichia coli]|uniref:DUF4132 domain-containing protein n=1 Tax=Escherichia coli TaxID=562 RepID=UPI0007494B5E|nr:DUF4132 domain-containing protein [Escherichia coli]KUG75173.1 hypothetical protein ARC81_07985 [Escherichia coli]KUG75877.1 hypothetical protein ARC96_07100 [Escherichia coli]MCQ7034325.1 DUF4132 domain-containing protein [Escherichia coli]